MSILQNTRLDDVIQHKTTLTKKSERYRGSGVVCLEHDMTVSHALKLLAKHRILSAPMVVSPSPLEDQETEAASAGTIGYNRPSLAGWCDVSDILNGLINQMRKLHPDGKLPTNLLRLMSELDKESKIFINRTLMEIAVGDDKSFMYESERGSSLLEALQGTFLNNGGIPGRVVHRVALFDPQGQISCVVSQLDVIKFIASQDKEVLGSSASKTIQELGLISEDSQKRLVCLDPHTPTLLALERMKEVAGVSGAAVVSPQTGCIIANLSLSDLRLITPEHFSVLALPVAEFLALLHNTSYLGYSQQASDSGAHPFFAQGPRSVGGDDQDEIPLYTCSKTSTLQEVLHILADRSVHRVYVVDPDARPNVIGVLTPTDLLRWTSSQAS